MKIIANDGQLPLLGYQGNYNRQNKFDRILASKSYDIIESDKSEEKFVIMISRWNVYLGNTISVTHKSKWLTRDHDRKESLKLFESYLNNSLIFFNKQGVKKVLLVLQFPEFKYDTELCSIKELEHCFSTFKQNEFYREETYRIMKKVTLNNPSVRIIDPLTYFCNDDSRCPQIIKHNNSFFPLTSDDNHPSRWASERFGEYIKNYLNWLIDR